MNNDEVLDKVTFHYECGTIKPMRTVTHVFDATDMDTTEMFMRWVHFMNGVGYVLDPVEMEEVWDGTKTLNEPEPNDDNSNSAIKEMALDVIAAGAQAQEAYQAQLAAEKKLAKAIVALEGVVELAEGYETLAPQLAKAIEVLEELKK